MKKKITIMALSLLCLLLPSAPVRAQVPIADIIKAALKKVIMALDLKVQQLQNKTIALQNAEKQLENTLHLNKLNDISGWLNKERSLFSGYYHELGKVRAVIAEYEQVKTIVLQQKQLLAEYRRASGLFRQDKHFTPGEISAMENIYGGILQESTRHLDELILAINSVSAKMDDAERLNLVHHASAGMQTNLDHLRQYNSQNISISLERTRSDQERQTLRTLYGIH